ncbi:MAG: hypothetical protein Q7V63_08970 [Gammaproteobacteria bacterium]|nr:hypothetical protein [Gammaproteobacteria bacterium]
MKKIILAIICMMIISPALAATPSNTRSNSNSNAGFEQAAGAIGIGAQTYNPHLSASSIKTAPNDDADDIIQNGISSS